MPIEMHVAPPTGIPQWWCLTDTDGAATHGAFEWSTREPDDATRCDGYYLWCRPSPLWRPATRDEAVKLAHESTWESMYPDESQPLTRDVPGSRTNGAS